MVPKWTQHVPKNDSKQTHNECKIDPGGYFIVRGAEKIVMCSESMANNKVFVFII